MLYYIISYYIILYHIISYYIMLHFIILYSTLRAERPSDMRARTKIAAPLGLGRPLRCPLARASPPAPPASL